MQYNLFVGFSILFVYLSPSLHEYHGSYNTVSQPPTSTGRLQNYKVARLRKKSPLRSGMTFIAPFMQLHELYISYTIRMGLSESTRNL